MGKARVTDNLGEGQYDFELIYSDERAQARIAQIQAKLDQIDNVEIIKLQADLADAQSKVDEKADVLDDAIAKWVGTGFWASGTDYTLDDRIQISGFATMLCEQSGRSGGIVPVWPDKHGDTIRENYVIWSASLSETSTTNRSANTDYVVDDEVTLVINFEFVIDNPETGGGHFEHLNGIAVRAGRSGNFEPSWIKGENIDGGVIWKREDNAQAIIEASKELRELAFLRDKAQASLNVVKTRKLTLEREKAWIENHLPDSVLKVAGWCADYSPDIPIDTEVETAEVTGFHHGGLTSGGKADDRTVLIRPQVPPADYPPQVLDPETGQINQLPEVGPGKLRHAVACTASECLYALMIEPGAEKWKPTWRVGIIDSIDRDADTCSVTLLFADAPRYSDLPVQHNINETVVLTDVPIRYMTCNSAAFEVGDRVLIEYAGQNRAFPTVRGFESNPRFCGIFLESGWIIINQKALYYATPQQNAFDSWSNTLVWLDETIFNPTKSRLKGPAPRSSLSYTDEIIDAGSGIHKDQISGFRLSEMGGKLKLAVQSMLGSNKPRPWSLGLAGDASTGSAGGDWLISKALVTTPDYEYFLLTIEAGKETAQMSELTLSLSGIGLQKWIKENAGQLPPKDLLKAEAYLLSTITGQGATRNIPLSIPEDIAGQPVFYGWHFSWEGFEGSLCTSQAYFEEESFTPYIKFHRARRWRFGLTLGPGESPALERFSATISKVEEVDYTPRLGKDLLWYPLPGFFLMVTKVWADAGHLNYNDSPSGGPNGFIDSDAPIYSYYDAANNLRIVRYSRQTITDTTTQEDLDLQQDIYDNANACGLAAFSIAADSYDSGVKAGFYIQTLSELAGTGIPVSYGGTLDYRGEDGSGPYAEASSPGGSVTGPEVTNNYVNTPIEYTNLTSCDSIEVNPGQPGTQKKEFGEMDRLREQGTFTTTFDSLCMIPFYSSESVYIGEFTRTQKLAFKHDQSTQSIVRVTAWNATEGPHTRTRESGWRGGLVGGGGLPPATTVDNYLGNIEKYTGDLTVIVAHKNGVTTDEELTLEYEFEKFTATQPTYSIINDVLTATGKWAQLFDPTFFGPSADITYNPFFVREGVQNTLYFSYSTDPSKLKTPDILLPGQFDHNSTFLGWG